MGEYEEAIKMLMRVSRLMEEKALAVESLDDKAKYVKAHRRLAEAASTARLYYFEAEAALAGERGAE